MPIIFPPSPTTGQIYAAGADSSTWIYNGTEWIVYSLEYGIDWSGGSSTTILPGNGIQVSGVAPTFTVTNLFDSGCFGITIEGGGGVPSTGLKGYLFVPYACTIDCWAVVADVVGSAVIDVWKGSAPFVVPLSAAESIAGTQKPTLLGTQLANNLSLTTWTTSLQFGDVIAFNLDSASTVSQITLQIKVIKI